MATMVLPQIVAHAWLIQFYVAQENINHHLAIPMFGDPLSQHYREVYVLMLARVTIHQIKIILHIIVQLNTLLIRPLLEQLQLRPMNVYV